MVVFVFDEIKSMIHLGTSAVRHFRGHDVAGWNDGARIAVATSVIVARAMCFLEGAA